MRCFLIALVAILCACHRSPDGASEFSSIKNPTREIIRQDDEIREAIITYRKKIDALRDETQQVIDGLDTLDHIAETGLLAAMHAKEVCSCFFVSKFPKIACDQMANIYISRFVVETTINGNRVESVQRIPTPLLETDPAKRRNIYYAAEFDPRHARLGCHLVEKGMR